MSELIYKAESFQIIGLCMEVHRELGKGRDEVVYNFGQDSLVYKRVVL